MYDIQYRPRKYGTSAAAVLPRRVRLNASTNSDSSCKSYSSSPSAHCFSPYSLASPTFAAACPTFIADDHVASITPAAAPAASPPKSSPGFEFTDDDTMQTLVEKFSTLESDIKSMLKGKDSLKDRIQYLGSKQESMKSVIQNLEHKQLGSIKSKLEVMEQQARSRDDYLKRLKKERIHSLEQARSAECLEPPALEHTTSSDNGGSFPDDKARPPYQSWYHPGSSQHEEKAAKNTVEPGLKKILSCWDENNCEVHLKRLIHSSRQIAAYEILEFAHKRLSTHLINHISETARDLVGDEKTTYLGQFLKNGPFESKPVGEGTYGELLKFVQRESKPKRELLKALKAAEDSLIQEAVSSGYRAIDVGDVRSQMTGFFTASMHRFNYPIPLADAEVTRDVIEDTRLAAEQGKLGTLQKASKLIKLGCYFLQWQLAAESP